MTKQKQATAEVTKLNPKLAQKIKDEIGQNVYLCYQCVKCTSGCPVVNYFDWQPNQVMRALQLGQEEIALQALRLVTIVKDMDLPLSLTQTTCQDAHEDEIKSLYQSLEFHSLLRHRQEKNEKAVSKEEKEKPRASLVRKADASTLETFCRDRVIGFFVLPKPADLFGSASIAFAFSDGKEFMVFSEPTEEEIKEAQRVLSLASTAIVCDLKKIFHLFGNVISGNFFDLELGYYLLHSGDRVHDVVDILRQTLGDRVSDTPISLASAGEEKRSDFLFPVLFPLFKKFKKKWSSAG